MLTKHSEHNANTRNDGIISAIAGPLDLSSCIRRSPQIKAAIMSASEIMMAASSMALILRKMFVLLVYQIWHELSSVKKGVPAQGNPVHTQFDAYASRLGLRQVRAERYPYECGAVRFTDLGLALILGQGFRPRRRRI